MLWSALASAGPLDSVPVQPGAIILQEGTATIAAGGGKFMELSTKAEGWYVIDFAVPPEKQLRIGIITKAQYDQMAKGEEPEGDVVEKYDVAGTGTRSVALAFDTYVIMFLNEETSDTTFSYRLSSFK
jgi:hypothetical protein